jgi:pimeloyl-ACP methyl ester carboxylesterase
MKIVDRGRGTPLIVVPGIQGRWEYVRPAVDALSESFRVITFSLRPSTSLEGFADQIGAVLDDRGLDRAAICGISFGGLGALHFAATRPYKTSALVLVSTPGPRMRLRPRHELYTRFPWLFGPLFVFETPRRLRREVGAAIPGRWPRLRFGWDQLCTFAGAGISFSRVAERARLIGAPEILDDCARITVPTLVVSGDPSLDYVVSADGTSQYVQLIAGARGTRLERTGHLGSITRPDLFASVVRDFMSAVDERNHAA